ncbi:MAG: PEGA domain-containing protein, partial [Polyangiaceae bacterium]
MEKDPGARFASMDDVLAALKRVSAQTAERSAGFSRADLLPPASTSASGPQAHTGSGRLPNGSISTSGAIPHPPSFTPSASTSELGGFPSPLGVNEGPASATPFVSTAPPAPGSKGMLAVAVVGALAVAGAIAFVVLRPAPPAPTPTTASSQAPAVASPAPAQPAAPAPPAIVKVRVNSDPDGASVKEDGVELCSSTPCDIVYKGPDADASREHKLTVARQGYKSESRTMHVTDGPVAVKLAKAELPKIVPQAKVETPSAGPPTGYKNDVPY